MPASALRRLIPLSLLLLAAACGGTREERYSRPAAAAPVVQLDHARLAVRDPAVARAMLEEAGFRFAAAAAAPRMLFENGYVELVPEGGAPFLIAFRHSGPPPAALLGPGPAGPSSIALALAEAAVDEAANRATVAAGGAAAEPFLHPNGTRRITGLRASAPTRAGLPAAASFVNLSGAAELRVATEWLMELELDHGAQNQELDLRPRAPLVVRF